MQRHKSCQFILSMMLAVSMVGCRAPRPGLSASHASAMQFYKHVASNVSYPDARQSFQSLGEAPRSIRHPTDDEIWHVTLQDVMHLALMNSKIIVSNSEFLSEGNRLFSNPDLAPSVFDLAIQENGILNGRRGLEAALSDFDPQFSSSMTWNRDENVQNNLFLSGGLRPGDTLAEESADFNARLEKLFANGGQVALTHRWNYSLNNAPGRLFPSAYTGGVGIEYRHPLWAGSGTEFTQIAGPVGQVSGRSTGVNQGIVIAKINSEMSLNDFEMTVRKQLFDVVNIFWDLHLAFQDYEIERDLRDSTMETWKKVQAKKTTGIVGGGAAEEAHVHEEYLASKVRTELALAAVWEIEARLRRLLVLPPNDGRLIRPSESPVTDEVALDWSQYLAEALVQRSVLRKQKSNIKSLELQYRAARSLVNPRLDFVAGYDVNGFGDQLYSSSDNDGSTTQGHRSAYGNILQGKQTGWQMGLVLSMPLGARAERSQVRYLELLLVKAKSVLAAQELEVSHELAHAFNLLDRWYTASQTNSGRQLASKERVHAYEVQYDLGDKGHATLDLMLRARISRAQSQMEYQRSVAEYNKAIANLHYRSATLMDAYHIRVAEQDSEHAVPELSEASDQSPALSDTTEWYRPSDNHSAHTLTTELRRANTAGS